METDWEERRELEERLAHGDGITVEQAQRLIDDADAGQRHEAKLESIVKAMWDIYSIKVIDSTTDDDEGEVRVELITDDTDAALLGVSAISEE